MSSKKKKSNKQKAKLHVPLHDFFRKNRYYSIILNKPTEKKYRDKTTRQMSIIM